MADKISIAPEAYKDLMVKLMAPLRGWLVRQKLSLAKAEPGTYVRGKHDAYQDTLEAIDDGIRKMK